MNEYKEIYLNKKTLKKLDHPADILINKENIREEKKELIEILKKIDVERERLNRKLNRTKEAEKQLNIIYQVSGLDFAYTLLAEKLNFDEHIEALKF